MHCQVFTAAVLNWFFVGLLTQPQQECSTSLSSKSLGLRVQHILSIHPLYLFTLPLFLSHNQWRSSHACPAHHISSMCFTDSVVCLLYGVQGLLYNFLFSSSQHRLILVSCVQSSTTVVFNGCPNLYLNSPLCSHFFSEFFMCGEITMLLNCPVLMFPLYLWLVFFPSLGKTVLPTLRALLTTCCWLTAAVSKPKCLDQPLTFSLPDQWRIKE